MASELENNKFIQNTSTDLNKRDYEHLNNEDSEESETSDIQEYSDSESEDVKAQIKEDMSMEELLALQDEIGIKAFSNKIKVNDKKYKGKELQKEKHFKRANKNRPSELPLQRKPAPRMNFLESSNKTIKKNVHRDPRFDDLSGKLDIMAWKRNYSFISSQRKNELSILKKQIKSEKDPEIKAQLKKTIQRINNQEIESKKKHKERELKKQQREEAISFMKAGMAPKYASRKEKTLSMKMSHFDNLVKDKRIDKYIEKKEKHRKNDF